VRGEKLAFRWVRGVALAAGVSLLGSSAVGCKRSERPAAQGDLDASSPEASLPDSGGEAGSQLAVADAAPPDDSIPAASSEDLSVRARHLLEAIAKDNSDLGSDILFPRDGWLATRDAADPGKDWDKRVAAPFRRSVHALSRHHEDLDRAQQVTLEIGHTVVQVTPRKHSWKKALWTVRGSRLTYVLDGHTRTLSIHEMTAWRGAWYVTRLR
jgi:hypothetical protein